MKQSNASERLRPWRVLSRELVLDRQPWLALWREKIRLPDGREIDDYYQIEQRDYVLIAACFFWISKGFDDVSLPSDCVAAATRSVSSLDDDRSN